MWGTIIGLLGTATSLYSAFASKEATTDAGEAAAAEKQRVAEYNSLISYKDADTMREAAIEEEFKYGLELINRTNQQLEVMGAVDVAFAKSGVSLGTGTTLDVAMENAREAAINTELIRYNGMKAAAYRRSQALSYEIAGEYGIRDAATAAANIIETAKDEGNALFLGGVAKTATSLYSVGSDLGWFSS
jgi:hypothetical protein